MHQLIWESLPAIACTVLVVLAPYTKVEESMALHAVYDLLSYGLDVDKVSGERLLYHEFSLLTLQLTSLITKRSVDPFPEVLSLQSC